MRHARQLQAQRRGGDIAGPAWPSIVATTTSLTGAAAGIATTLVWSDPLHLRLGVGMAAAGAVFSSVAMFAARRDRSTRRELVATLREDHAAELRYETTRRDKQISDLKTDALAAEETVVLFEERAKEEQLRADASEAARVRAEHDLAVLSAWVQQTTAAAELTRSAVQSFAQVQPFEPAQQFEPVSVHDHAFASYQAARTGAYELEYDPAYAAQPVYDAVPAYETEYAAYTDYVDYAEFTDQGYGATTYATTPAGAEIDLRPAAAVPVRAPEPQLSAALPAAEPRPLRSAVLAVRDEVGFDVAGEVAGPGRDPYTVPGVVMPRQRADGLPPSLPQARPVPPERLYRPYLATDQGTASTSNAAPVDLTMYDETQQMARIEHRETGTG
ncbi:hypothetical protein Caci_8418 [Catenulispora acidiphila DSM 44928]|uniref:Uncharacterized protein n=1 Tax=Catenulispora acidiphila (strain DSM 44928 / JCM 14897 / NBRC 102108 / NRRL B-24433 / ID139908) TaxID=479433 RepID=C7PWY4_CATAD|nr:hypothetical protein [Catenulispora acidiphila]ACU77241.1 hypothetical protein Caci_8418 [Catenulispora acidiphila DSM 44928]